MSYFFKYRKLIRDQYLYKEGDPSENVYIVLEGEVRVYKKIVKYGDKSENVKEIKENPLKANRHHTKFFRGNKVKEEDIINLFIIGKGNLIGEEDAL